MEFRFEFDIGTKFLFAVVVIVYFSLISFSFTEANNIPKAIFLVL